MYRTGFSRYIQKKKALDEFRLVRPEIPEDTAAGLPLDLDEFPKDFKTNPAYEYLRTEYPTNNVGEEKTVCIIGAGAAGLFTAMLFDYLNANAKMNIKYDILEAADGTVRKGGRLFTYRFPKDADPKKNGSHDYYDVGAMRFPEAPQMDRLFHLFQLLGMNKDKSDTEVFGNLLPYYMHSQWPMQKPTLPPPPPTPETACYDPYYFNKIQYASKNIPKGDAFDMNATTNPQHKIDEAALNRGAEQTLNIVIVKFIVNNNIYKKDDKGNPAVDPVSGNVLIDYDKLWQFDSYSTRAYLQGSNDSGPGFNYFTIQWLETFGGGTGWYDQAWLETVLEYLDFNPLLAEDVKNINNPDYVPKQTSYNWWCINGGAGLLIDRMEANVNENKGAVTYGQTVTKIGTVLGAEGGGLEVSSKDKDGKTTKKVYNAVFASPPLGSMRRIDLDDLDTLEYETRLALRCLTYGPSTKVGMKFKTPWWRQDKFKVGLGGVGYTDQNLRMCVYPSYSLKNGEKPDDKEPGVVIVSYSWSQDALRMGTITSRNSPDDEKELKDLLLHELAKLHSNPETGPSYDEAYKIISGEYMDHYAWNWYASEDSTGAFAFFGAGQYSSLWPSLMQQESLERLFIIGEHTSAFHAWVIGAIDSAQRAVWQFCQANGFIEAAKTYLEKVPEGADPATYPYAPLPPDFDKDVQQMRHNLLRTKIVLKTKTDNQVPNGFAKLLLPIGAGGD